MISVVIPTYGRPASVIECVESVLNNNYSSEYEILIIDQAPDSTLGNEVHRRYGNTATIRYFFLDVAGASRARNLGVRCAHGEIVAFIDDDVIADPGWLKSIARTFCDVHPRPGLMAGRILPIWLCSRPRWLPREREFLLGLYDIGDQAKLLPDADLPLSANMAALRQLVIDIGGFDERLGFDYSRKEPMIAGEDSMLGQQLKDAGHLIYYQPAAIGRHKISKLKLSPRYFLRRHFWEGVTVVTCMKLMGTIKRDASASIISYHIRAMTRSAGRLIFAVTRAQCNRPRSSAAMLELSHICYSLGAIYAAARLSRDAQEKSTKCTG